MLKNLVQILSGGVAYYVSVALYDLATGGRFVPGPAFVLIVSVTLAFASLTIIWHRVESNSSRVVPLEINLLIGPILSLSLYFTLQPSPIDLSVLEKIWALIGGYLILPLLLITIQQTPMGWALDLLSISTLITGVLVRRSKRPRAQAF